VHYAVGASLISVIGTSSGAQAPHGREGFSNTRIGLFLEIATTMGAICGAFLSTNTPTKMIAIVFGLRQRYFVMDRATVAAGLANDVDAEFSTES
jgi:hypothetical protein